ncbi:hypothetical protein [Gordonia malaquae]|uniref:hypothetical protein n=1 Tax=Gordonia malaquae TaxID=410332 RepID=UPI00301A2197
MSTEKMMAVAVGQPFPDTEIGRTQGTHWGTTNGMLLISQPGITVEEIDSWGPLTRVHFNAHRGVIVVTLQYLAQGVSVEIPGFRQVGSDFPDWAVDRGGDHLALSVVVVDSTTGIVVAMRLFTVSPHSTKAVIAEARERWGEPVDPQTAAADFLDYQRRYPTDKAVRGAAFTSCRPGD